MYKKWTQKVEYHSNFTKRAQCTYQKCNNRLLLYSNK